MSSFHQRHSLCRRVLCLLTIVGLFGRAHRLLAQEHEHEHDPHDGPIHFAHPLFTESPSPDTKLRVDYLFRQVTSGVHEHSMRLEGEYAFTPSISIEANIPITSRSESGTSVNSVGSGFPGTSRGANKLPLTPTLAPRPEYRLLKTRTSGPSGNGCTDAAHARIA